VPGRIGVSMSRHERATRIDRVRTVAGLAAAVVPFAILVHLIAEAASLGSAAGGVAFIVRHIYLGVVLVATATWFGGTVGVGRSVAERRRRCALIGAQLRGGPAGASVASLAAANIAFFGLSQLVEGVPIASGDWCFGLVAAAIGALVSALFVFVFGRSIIIAALIAAGIFLRECAPQSIRKSPAPLWIAPRSACASFSLFIPNRPPPAASPV
jgi:hypothetical protein